MSDDPNDFDPEVLRAAAEEARKAMGPDRSAVGGPMRDVLREAEAFAFRPPLPARTCSQCSRPLTVENTIRGGGSTNPHHSRMCDACLALYAAQERDARAGKMLPESFAWASFGAGAMNLSDRVESKGAIHAALEALQEPRVVFTGHSSAGKTSLACASLRARYVETGEKFRFEPAWNLAVARQRHPLGAGDPPAIVDSIRATILLIDDLGNERPGPTSVQDIEIVIYERHLHARPTWVTTWMGVDDVAKRYGENVARRIFERSVVIQCGAAGR